MAGTCSPRSVSAVVIASAGALVIGALTLRLTGFNLAIATLGIHLILIVMVTQWEFTGEHARRHRRPTVPDLRRRHVQLVPLLLRRPRLPRRLPVDLPATCGARGSGAACAPSAPTKHGTRSLGVRAFRLKLIVFVVSGAMGGLAGVLWAYFVRFAAPSTWDVRPHHRPRHLRHRRRAALGVRRRRRRGRGEHVALPRHQQRDGWRQPGTRSSSCSPVVLLVLFVLDLPRRAGRSPLAVSGRAGSSWAHAGTPPSRRPWRPWSSRPRSTPRSRRCHRRAATVDARRWRGTASSSAGRRPSAV